MIDSSEISVVVQGAVETEATQKCLKSIRKYLPKAEIILSTWCGTDASSLDYDQLVLSKDPGGKLCDFVVGVMNNVNRQLVSTQAGIERASREYCLKLRTDAVLEGDGFLYYWNKFSKRNPAFSFFRHRILVSSVYAREKSCQHGTGMPVVFHPSDFWFFGLLEDLQNYFLSTPVMPERDMCDWQYKYPNRIPYSTPLWRYAPEQYYLISYLKRLKGFVFSYDDWSDWNEKNINISQEVLYNNFVFLGFRQSDIANLKHVFAYKNDDKISHLITFQHFQKRYKELCEPLYVFDGIEHRALKVRKYFNKIEQELMRFYFPFSVMWRFLCAPPCILVLWIKAMVKNRI